MIQRRLSAIESRKLNDFYAGFIEIRKPDCDYCQCERKEDSRGNCSHCGAELRGLARIALDPITGEHFEVVVC